MPITMNTNISAMVAQRNLSVSSNRSASSLAKLSSGSRVPSSKDDAAALSIGMGLSRDVSALKAAQINAQQGMSVYQIADGAFGQIGDILIRMKSLATTSLSEQLSATERGFLSTEFTALRNEIDRIAGTTEFNNIALLGGSSAYEVSGLGADFGADDGIVGFAFDSSKSTVADEFEAGFDLDGGGAGIHHLTIRNNDTNVSQTLVVSTPGAGTTTDYNFDDIGVTITVNDQFIAFGAMTADNNVAFAGAAADQFTTAAAASTTAATINIQVGIDGTGGVNQIGTTIALGNYVDLLTTNSAFTDISSTGNAATATADIDEAIASVNSARASLGSIMNRLEFAQSNIAVAVENTEAARSAMMDVDVSAEMTEFTSQQVLIQAGVSMLAQANQQPSLLLRLLQ